MLTGASGGIGAATAAALVRDGARVLLVARTRAPLAALATALSDGAAPGQVEALAADVTTRSGRADIVELAAARRVDVLINNAGTPFFGALQAADDATHRESPCDKPDRPHRAHASASASAARTAAVPAF